MVEVQIRSASGQDLPAIMALEAECFVEDAWSQSAWAAELIGSDRLVLLATDLTAGLAAAATFHLVDQTAELFRVMTAADWRGRGLATKLIEEGWAWAAGLGALEMLLEVRDGSEAVALYQEIGFEVISRRRDYYGLGQDALIMQRSIKGEGDDD